MKITILFLSANPFDSTRLRVNEEYKEIEKRIQLSKYGKQFKLQQSNAVSLSEVQESLLKYMPNIVHFSGHGSEDGKLIFQNEKTGLAETADPEALAEMFGILNSDPLRAPIKAKIRCVVLNACFTDKNQAKAIAKYVDCVIGMSDEIGDQSAIDFASSFYQALAFGRTVKTAFLLGCNQLGLGSNPDENIIKIETGKRIDPANIVLAGKKDPPLVSKRSKLISPQRETEVGLAAEARKRLYEEFEPLLPQLNELSQNAYAQIRDLAKDARNANLEPRTGKLSINIPKDKNKYEVYQNTEEYRDKLSYITYNAYRLFAPLGIIRIMRRIKLGFFDLTINPYFKQLSDLADILYSIPGEDFRGSRVVQDLRRFSHVPYQNKEIVEHPNIETKLQEVRRMLDTFAEGLFISDASETQKKRMMTYGEFYDACYDPNTKSSTSDAFYRFRNLMEPFHPRDQPELWILLLSLAHIYRLIAKVYEAQNILKIEIGQHIAIPQNERIHFDWRQQKERSGIADAAVLKYPFEEAEKYVMNMYNSKSGKQA